MESPCNRLAVRWIKKNRDVGSSCGAANIVAGTGVLWEWKRKSAEGCGRKTQASAETSIPEQTENRARCLMENEYPRSMIRF